MIELLRTVSLRHLLTSPLRSLLVLFGIALGVATLVATIAVNRSIVASFHDMVEKVAGKADLVITSGESGVPDVLIEEIRSLPGVAHIAGSLEITTRRPGAGGPLLILGVDFLGDEHFLPMRSQEGIDVVDDPFSLVNDPNAILVSATLAKSAKLDVGSEFELLTPSGLRAFTIAGILTDEGLAASFGGQVAMMFTEAAQLAFGRSNKLDRIDIAAKDGTDIDALREQVDAVVNGRGTVERPEGRTRHLEAITGHIRRALSLAGMMALLVGMFLIYNAVSVSVAQRQREIGILRALGVTRRRVVAMFSIEALVLALVGSTIGLGLGFLISKGALLQIAPTISRFYAPIRPPPPVLSWEIAVIGMVVGLLSTLLAAYVPAREAARVDPVEPLRRSTKRLTLQQLPHTKMAIFGAILLVPAVVLAQFSNVITSFASIFFVLAAGLFAVPAMLLGLQRIAMPTAERLFGIMGFLAIENSGRSLGRSSLTIAALMTSMTSSVCVGSWAVSLQSSMFEWLEQSLPADLYVTSGSFIADQHNIPFAPEVMEKLKGAPGIATAYPVRLVALDVGEKRIELVATDLRAYYEELARKGIGGKPSVAGPAHVDPEVLIREPQVVLAENAARKLNLDVGDALVLETSQGRKAFKVYAIVVDYTSDQGTCLMDLHWYREFWGDPLIDTIDIFVEKNAPFAEVREEVKRRLGGGDTLFVVSAADVREEILMVIKDSLAIFGSTDLVALTVALLGVIGTMFAAVLDRIRETGVLRAIGATKKQVVSAIVIEAGFLGVVAAIGGLVVGVPMGYIFVKVVGMVGTGWRVDYLFPVAGAIRVASLVILTATLAGVYPGRRAVELEVTEALAYE